MKRSSRWCASISTTGPVLRCSGNPLGAGRSWRQAVALTSHDQPHSQPKRTNPSTNRQDMRAKGTAISQVAVTCAQPDPSGGSGGPCYLKGPVRFYGLNVIDTATVRCGLYTAPSKSGQDILDGFWAIWKRMGIPDNIQVDNAMSFFGSPTHPEAWGRLSGSACIMASSHGSSPWRNRGETA